jgi:hypothetical protein
MGRQCLHVITLAFVAFVAIVAFVAFFRTPL